MSLCLVSLGGLATPRPSLANGRYPMANQLVARPGAPDHLVARSTFGLLRSDDGGASWTWVCEEALGMLDAAEDPSLAVTGDGSTLVAYSQGLSVSHDGCSWSPATGIPAGRFGVDVTVSPTRPHAALAIQLEIAGGGYGLHLVTSTDDGATWAEAGQPIPGLLGATVEVAPSNPGRVYISGNVVATGAPLLARSDDGGLTFVQQPIAGAPADANPFIGAVDGADPDVVYLRLSPTAAAPAQVIVTRDGGATFAVLVTLPGDVSGFALSSDGATLAVGGVDSGLFVGSSAGGAFPLTGGIKPSCLTWVGTRLFACARESIDRFSIAVSDDLGAHFAPQLRLADVAPAACPATSTAGVCALRWPQVAATIGADAGTPVTDAGAAPATTPSGCSCALVSPPRAVELAWWTLLFAIALIRLFPSRSARRGQGRRRGIPTNSIDPSASARQGAVQR